MNQELFINEKINKVSPDFQSFGKISQKSPFNSTMYFDDNSCRLGFILFGLLSGTVIAFLLPLFFFIALLIFGMRKLLDSFMFMMAEKKGYNLFGIFTCRNHLILSMGYNDLSVIPFSLIRSKKSVTKSSHTDSIFKIRKIEFVYLSPEDQVEYCLEYITGPLHHQVVSELKKAIGKVSK